MDLFGCHDLYVLLELGAVHLGGCEVREMRKNDDIRRLD